MKSYNQPIEYLYLSQQASNNTITPILTIYANSEAINTF